MSTGSFYQNPFAASDRRVYFNVVPGDNEPAIERLNRRPLHCLGGLIGEGGSQHLLMQCGLSVGLSHGLANGFLAVVITNVVQLSNLPVDYGSLWRDVSAEITIGRKIEEQLFTPR